MATAMTLYFLTVAMTTVYYSTFWPVLKILMDTGNVQHNERKVMPEIIINVINFIPQFHKHKL